ncbi:hypothetical protein [Collimonas sp.]|jgi:hypothetical protein|uniref:hypothetical protein n=1 Tax=Collimonas sp. TaxID=1963772 RepID=UPI0037C045E3
MTAGLRIAHGFSHLIGKGKSGILECMDHLLPIILIISFQIFFDASHKVADFTIEPWPELICGANAVVKIHRRFAEEVFISWSRHTATSEKPTNNKKLMTKHSPHAAASLPSKPTRPSGPTLFHTKHFSFDQ